jgi:hypothetical protein
MVTLDYVAMRYQVAHDTAIHMVLCGLRGWG